MSETAYRRLPGRSGFLVRKSLWLGPDHLLRVRSNFFSQDYRRYYFHDIQAIVITELPNDAAAGYYALGGGALLGALSTLYFGHLGWALACGIAGAIFLAMPFLMANCRCFIKTSVSTEKLAALKRLRAARKTAAILRAEIEKAQGPLDPRTLLPVGTTSIAPPPILLPAKVVRYDHWIHAAFFAMMLALSGVTALSTLSRSPAFGYVDSALSYAVLLLAVISAVVQRGTDLARNVRAVVVAALVWYGVSVVGTVAATTYVAVRLGPKIKDAAHHPALIAVQAANAVAFLILGCLGLALLRQYRRESMTTYVETPEPPPLVMAPPPLPETAPDDVRTR